jgi:hypothetical protein
MNLDEVADLPEIETTPVKHGVAGARIALSPSKIKTHFNTVKTCRSE